MVSLTEFDLNVGLGKEASQFWQLRFKLSRQENEMDGFFPENAQAKARRRQVQRIGFPPNSIGPLNQKTISGVDDGGIASD